MPKLTNLRNLLKQRGKSEELSKSTGISSGNISDWKSGRSKPGLESLIKIANHFDCSVDYLLGLTDIEKRVTSKSNIVPIPIVKQRAAAGLGIETDDYSDYIDEYKFFDKNQIPSETQFGIIIEGDSMEPRFNSGQTIFVKLADDCNDSWFGIFCITDNDGITKVVFKQKIMTGEYTYKLHSLNYEKYADIIDERCRCVAVLVD